MTEEELLQRLIEARLAQREPSQDDLEAKRHPGAGDSVTDHAAEDPFRGILQSSEKRDASYNYPDEQKKYNLQVISNWIQFFLFLATCLAFTAAAIYAVIASRQADIMEKQMLMMTLGINQTEHMMAQYVTQTRAAQASAESASKQLPLLRRANQISSDALISVQRAYLLFGQNLQAVVVPSETDRDHADRYEFRPVIQNTGTTPTKHATHRMNWRAFPGDMPDGFNFADIPGTITRPVPFIVGPREPTTGTNLVITTETLSAVQHHTLHLYFWGWALYRDVLPHTPEHVTMFCAQLADIRGDIANAHGNPSFVWGLCEHHNCADADCDGEPNNPVNHRQ